MRSPLVYSDEFLFQSPAIIWQGMSNFEIEKEVKRLALRRRTIDRFVQHLRTNLVWDYSEYERFCDLMSTEGVDPILWIDGAVENINYAIEEAIKNANR